MRKTILLYGISLAALLILLKVLEYSLFVRDLSLELYVGVIAVLFTVVGIWAGRKLVTAKPHSSSQTALVPSFPSSETFTINNKALEKLSISPREYEVLELIAAGHSNQEIADKLYVSLSTVKTHSSNLFMKLDVKRRTQAVQKAKELRLIP